MYDGEWNEMKLHFEQRSDIFGLKKHLVQHDTPQPDSNLKFMTYLRFHTAVP